MWLEQCLWLDEYLASLCLMMAHFLCRCWSFVTSDFQRLATGPLALIGKLLQLLARRCRGPHAMPLGLCDRANQDRRVSKLKGRRNDIVVEARPLFLVAHGADLVQ